ncbi:hypothetical protein [Rhodovulum adriaticum]|uniref:Phage integrase family protein n=1 Tax=Rhodovulum adriaticum TaxID=35804 RepID=A0A4R2NZA0_RHOAD|nr:hypothetical protein [Rhodovulum adriaticum]MBK1634815.1 hypothetical protein [Rhodovulum adriaticum]TCP27610.1 hypothetical protein EV656_101519 [Rhodovulum adriaticum]
MTAHPTFEDILRAGAADPDNTVRRYAADLDKMLTLNGITKAHRAEMAGTVETYLAIAPKVSPEDVQLARLIGARGWTPKTYTQYRSNGRRMIEHVTGDLAARRAVRDRDDEWEVLSDRAGRLRAEGLLTKHELAGLRSLALAARRRDILPTTLTTSLVQDLVDAAANYDARKQIKRGATCLNRLRDLTSLHNLLPPAPLGVIETATRQPVPLEGPYAVEAARWIETATTTIPDNIKTAEARETFKTQHAEGSRGIFRSALNRYIRTATALEAHASCPPDGLAGLFDPATVERVIASWIEDTRAEARTALSKRSLYSYVDKLRITLSRNGYRAEAQKVMELRNDHALLIEGRMLSQFMSATTETWCRNLIEDEEKTCLFELQHVRYWEIAKKTLAAAAAEGFDLVRLSRPDAMKALPRRKRARAKKLLRRARRFGVCAAYAAIGREGVPFRMCNMLALCSGGPVPTFFDHSGADAPRFVVKVPNELIKNGDSLTMRNQSIPPIPFAQGEEGSFAFDILMFFRDEIRPLFPGASASEALFPGLNPGDHHLNEKTFNRWLMACSSEIGLPMKSHNFRHGEASLMINEDPSCIETIAMTLGDRPDTVRRYYAFLHPQKLLREMQKKRNARRKELIEAHQEVAA